MHIPKDYVACTITNSQTIIAILDMVVLKDQVGPSSRKPVAFKGFPFMIAIRTASATPYVLNGKDCMEFQYITLLYTL